MNETNHKTCASCETVSHCVNNGCVPLAAMPRKPVATINAANHYQAMASEAENEKLRKRVQELEAEIAAIGAGGVESLRKPAALQVAPPAPAHQGLTTQQVEDVLLDAGLSQEMREAIIFDLVDAEAAGEQAAPPSARRRDSAPRVRQRHSNRRPGHAVL